jgi:hypothetical protein
MAEMPTLPGWSPSPRKQGSRPWYAAALIAGFGGVLAVLFGLGLIGHGAQGAEPAPDQARLGRIESRLDDIGQRLSHIEGQLAVVPAQSRERER